MATRWDFATIRTTQDNEISPEAIMAVDETLVTSDLGTATIRKLRNRILPLLFLLYVVAFLDRINIGFAALTMNSALHITSSQFGLVTGVFFLGYFLLEIPSNLLLHKIGARVWIARILISWGFIAVLTGFVRSTPQLYAARFLLGAAEAGFFPGVLLYLTYWFRRREQARVIALFMVAVPISGILGAPISGLILDHVHWLAISSWRWLLILEGFPAVLCGILTYFALPSRPSEAAFLTSDEKAWIEAAMTREHEEKASQHPMSEWQALSHGRVWHLALISFAFQIGIYAMFFWMPQAIRGLSHLYSNTTIGILGMIPYLTGAVVMIFVSRSSDHKMERRYHAAIPVAVAGLAFILLGTTAIPWISVLLWCFVAIGVSSFTGPFWSMPNEFLTGVSAASGIALVTSIGSLGGFVGPYAIGYLAKGSGGISKGLMVAAVSLFAAACLALLLPNVGRREVS